MEKILGESKFISWPGWVPKECRNFLKDTSVAVVGGGFAGLSAAWWLAQAGVIVHLYEAGSQLGGRVRTSSQIATGRLVDAGGELVGAHHIMWLHLARRFGVALMVRTDGDDYAKMGLETKLWIDGDIPPREAQKLTKQMEDKIFRPMGKDASLINLPSRPWAQSSLLKRFDDLSVAQKLSLLGIKNSELLWKGMKALVQNNNVAALEEMNYLGLLCLINGGRYRTTEDRDGWLGYWRETEVFRCNDGSWALANAIATELDTKSYRCTFHLSTPVLQIDVSKRPKLTGPNGELGSFDYVIFAVPPSVWKDIKFRPEHPRDSVGLMNMGPAVKYFNRFGGRPWIQMRSAPNAISSRIGMVWEGTDAQATVGRQEIVLSVFAGGPGIPNQTELDNGLEELYPGIVRKRTGKSIPANWPAEPFIKTGYTSPKKGQILTVGKRLNEPFHERLFFAGDHTQMNFFGYMEGALRSGARAARDVRDHACKQAQRQSQTKPLVAKGPDRKGLGERETLAHETEAVLRNNG
jgi:monoamine oxidase